MKDTKKWRNTFDLYDKYRLAEYFEEQAKDGWILEDSSGSFLFRRVEPRNLHYSIVYYTEATAFDTEPTEAQKTLYDFCAHSGWKLVTVNGFYQVFCNEQESPIPIETEQKLELENIHKLQKRQQKYAYPLYIIGSLLIILRILSLASGTASNLGCVYDIASIYAWSMLILISVFENIIYGRWYRRARQFVAAGMRIPAVPCNRMRKFVESILFVMAIAALSVSGAEASKLGAGSTCFIFLLLLAIFGVARVLRGEQYSRFSGQSKERAFIWISVGVTLAFSGVLLAITLL